MTRQTPGHGMAERSRTTRKLSVAFPNADMDWLEAEAKRHGMSAATIVRWAVRAAMLREAAP